MASAQLLGNRSMDRLLPLVFVPVLVFSVLPVIRLTAEGIVGSQGVTFSVYADVLRQPETWTAFRHSLVTAGLGTVISLVLGGLFAFLVALTDIRARGVLVFALMIPMMIPPQITALAWVQTMGPSSVLLKTLGIAPPLGSPQPLYSPGGIAVLLGIQHVSIVFLTVRANLRVIPAELIEAARLSGARGLQVWWQIVLPLVTPGLIAGGAMAFVTALGNFGISAMLGIPANYTTLPTLIYQKLAGFGSTVLAEVSVLGVLIGAVAIAGVALNRRLMSTRSYRLIGMSGRPLSIALGPLRPFVEAGLWAIILAILVLPLTALLVTSVIPAFGVPLTLESWTWDAYQEVLFSQPATLRAFVNSGALASGAAVVLMALCLPIAYLIARGHSRLLRVFDGLVEVPYALPGVVLAIACILIFTRIPFLELGLYGTIWIIFVAYLARFLVVMLRPVLNAVSQLDRALEEAAQAAGAGLLTRLRTIVLPLVAPSAAAGGLLVFLIAFNELTVSALLWSAGNETLGVVIFNLDDSGDTVLASAVAMLVVLVVVVLMASFELLGRRLPKGVIPWHA